MSHTNSYVITENEMRSLRYLTNDFVRNDEVRLKLDTVLRAVDGKGIIIVVKTEMAKHDMLIRANSIAANVEIITMDELILGQSQYKRKKLIMYHMETTTILPISIQLIK